MLKSVEEDLDIKAKYLDFRKTLKTLKFPKMVKDTNFPNPIDGLDHIIEDGFLIGIFKDIVPGIREKNKMKIYQLITFHDFDKSSFDIIDEVDVNYKIDHAMKDYDYNCHPATCRFADLVQYIFEMMGYRANVKMYYVMVHGANIMAYRMRIYLDWSDNKRPFWEDDEE